jgi:hypothetical protein
VLRAPRTQLDSSTSRFLQCLPSPRSTDNRSEQFRLSPILRFPIPRSRHSPISDPAPSRISDSWLPDSPIHEIRTSPRFSNPPLPRASIPESTDSPIPCFSDSRLTGSRTSSILRFPDPPLPRSRNPHLPDSFTRRIRDPRSLDPPALDQPASRIHQFSTPTLPDSPTTRLLDSPIPRFLDTLNPGSSIHQLPDSPLTRSA